MKTHADFSASVTDSLYHPVDIGSLHCEGNLFFAPMAGYTDRITRAFAYMHGANLCYTEMISCEGIVRGGVKTRALLEPFSPETPALFIRNDMIDAFLSSFSEKRMHVQLFSGNPETAGNAARIIARDKPELIDINCGCPMSKVCKTGAGAALLARPHRIADIIQRVKDAADCPVTIKIRSGIGADSLNYPDVMEKAVEAGVDMITLHPRTQKQGYAGTANWDHLRDAVRIFGSAVPVFGSGDLFTPEDAKRMLEYTGCAGVMFARGAIGNPGIFLHSREILSSVATEDLSQTYPALAPGELPLLHLELAVRTYGEKTGTSIVKKFLAAYIKNIPGGAAYRRILMTSTCSDEMKRVIESIPFLSKP